MGDLSKNFSAKEFACSCCGASNISPALVADLQRLREAIGSPLSITSGVRCKAHNKAVGGVEGSAHVPADLGDGEGKVGHAVDIACTSGVLRFKLLAYAPQMFKRIGVGATFIHLDNDTNKAQGTAWDYYGAPHVA
jgi:zinc D-Ala-D-Ala carboxypeptidase